MADEYTLIFKPNASKAIDGLPKPIKKRLIDRVAQLASDPRPSGCVKLTGFDRVYRIRVGDYRIVYEIRDDGRIVIVLIIAHRRDVYRGL